MTIQKCLTSSQLMWHRFCYIRLRDLACDVVRCALFFWLPGNCGLPSSFFVFVSYTDLFEVSFTSVMIAWLMLPIFYSTKTKQQKINKIVNKYNTKIATHLFTLPVAVLLLIPLHISCGYQFNWFRISDVRQTEY